MWVSQTAETILKLVTRRLQEFGVELHNITAFVTDGASIMMKLGSIAPCEHIVLFITYVAPRYNRRILQEEEDGR